ncbi:MAG: TIGR02302 family protein [Rhodobacterales bacterium]
MKQTPGHLLQRLRWPLFLTRAGLLAERLWQAFWPLWTVIVLVLAALMLGLHDSLPIEVVWTGMVVAGLGALAAALRGFMRFRWPTRAEALARLDASLPGRPISAVLDQQAIGGTDAASVAVWKAHQARMAAQAGTARAVSPDLDMSPRDPFATRYVALLALAVAILFGSILRVGSVAEMTPGSTQAAMGGPTWEGWIEPPAYTGQPTLYLADQRGESIEVPQGSRITLRLYGELGALRVTQDLAETVGAETPDPATPAQDLTVTRSGTLAIDGPGGREWDVTMRPDAPPRVAFGDPAQASLADMQALAQARAEGQMSLPFTASDDYGVVAGQARITLDLETIPRRHGLRLDPEPRDAIVLDLPMPISGSRKEFTETLVDNLSQHPWANLPVRVELSVTDAAGLEGSSGAEQMTLPARRFFDPLANAVIEQRRDLLWSADNARRVSQVIRTISHRPEEGLFRSETSYLRLRVILRRLEAMTQYGLRLEQRDEIAQALWELALLLEEGDIGDALERLQRAQERLSEAMKNGASDQEIAELMQELRDATDNYMNQLAQQAMRDGTMQDSQDMAEGGMQMGQDDLQAMMDRIQELMEEGRMAEAQQALEELQRLMENMQIAQGQGGQGQQSPGQQAMEGLAETLRDQQGLSDQAFRDLQERFNPGGDQGQQQGQQQGQGQQPGQQQGQGRQPGQQQGQGQGQDRADQQGEGQGDAQGSLAERQRALRNELDRQSRNLPNIGGEAGEAAREALDRAGRAMDGAEQALRGNDLAEAIDQQAEAMDALRDGMRNMGEAMAEAEREQRGGQGQEMGRAGGERRDPLGRDSGTSGQTGTDENLLQGEDVYRRARDLLDEIRRRSGEGARPEEELDYLRRLLERF